MSKHPNKQLAVRLYRSEKQFGLAAPLPGLEPEDIQNGIGKNVLAFQEHLEDTHSS